MTHNVCTACEKITYVAFCHYCRDYKNVIPVEESKEAN
jgi:hypothetical protein